MKNNQNMTREHCFGAPCRNLTCLSTLSLGKMHICVFPECFSFMHFFWLFLLLLDIKTKVIKFCTEFWIKQVNVLPRKCTSLLVFQNFQKTVHALRTQYVSHGITALSFFLFFMFLNQVLRLWKHRKIWI